MILSIPFLYANRLDEYWLRHSIARSNLVFFSLKGGVFVIKDRITNSTGWRPYETQTDSNKQWFMKEVCVEGEIR